MKKVSLLILPIIVLAMACSSTSSREPVTDIVDTNEIVVDDTPKNELENQQEKTYSGSFDKKSMTDKFPVNFEDFFKTKISEILNKGERFPFENDSTFEISNIEFYRTGKCWNIFLIQGNLLPSTANYHFYGGYKNISDVKYQFYSLPIESYVEFTRYSATTNELSIYGFVDDENTERGQESLIYSHNSVATCDKPNE